MPGLWAKVRFKHGTHSYLNKRGLALGSKMQVRSCFQSGISASHPYFGPTEYPDSSLWSSMTPRDSILERVVLAQTLYSPQGAFLLAADEACIEAAGEAHIGRTLHQRSPVRKQRDGVVSALETQQEPVEVDLAVRLQAALHLGKVNWAMMFMDLHRVPPAKRDLGAVLSPKMGKVPQLANRASRSGGGGVDLGLVVGPEVAAQQGAAHLVARAHKKLQRLGDLHRGGEIDGRVENAGRVAGGHHACGRLGKETGQAGSLSRQNIHRSRVSSNGGSINPRPALLDGVVVQQVARLEIIRGVEHNRRLAEQGVNIGRHQIGHMRQNLSPAVKLRNFAPGGFRLGQGFTGIRLVEKNLPLQIALLHEVAIDQGQGTYPGTRQQRRRRGPRRPTAHHHHMAPGQLPLPALPNPGIKHLARVTFLNQFHCALPYIRTT